MSETVSLLGQILLSLKIMSEPDLLTLQRIVQQESEVRQQRKVPDDQAQDYDITAKVALADLIIKPLNNESIQNSLPQLNNAELRLVSFAFIPCLRCDDILDGTAVSERRQNGTPIISMVALSHGLVRKEDSSRVGRSKIAEIFRTVQREIDAGNREKAVALLNDYIKLNEEADQPTFGLKLHREFTFFHQVGDYEPVISLSGQSLAASTRAGNLFWQVAVLEIMAFAALRMGQKSRAESYLDQIVTGFAMPAPGDIARMTAYFDLKADVETRSLLQARIKSAMQLRDLLSV